MEVGPLSTKESLGGGGGEVQSDQGREFINSLSEDLFKLTGVEHIVSTAYPPQTIDGPDEHFYQPLQRSLLKMIKRNEHHWEKFLDSVVFAYCTSKQATTKYSQFFIMYGREPRLPIDSIANIISTILARKMKPKRILKLKILITMLGGLLI